MRTLIRGGVAALVAALFLLVAPVGADAAGQAASVRTFFLMRAKRTVPAPAPNAGAIFRIEAYMPALHTMFCRDVVFGIGRVLPHQFMNA